MCRNTFVVICVLVLAVKANNKAFRGFFHGEGALHDELTLIRHEMADMKNELEQQRHSNRRLEETITELKQRDNFMTSKIRSLETECGKTAALHTYNFDTVGCFMDVLRLACPTGTKINVTSAIFGQYSSTCNEHCCEPSPSDDCVEQIVDNSIGEWLSLKYQCDNMLSCSYEYDGAIINQCELEYVADYMQIFYNCQPDVVAFTAYATEHRNYSDGDIVIFDDILTNLGDHYNAANSTFTCPYNGVYVFSTNFNSLVDTRMLLHLNKESVSLFSAWADRIPGPPNVASHSSAQVITECYEGERVYPTASEGAMYSQANVARGILSGYILQRFT